MGRRRERKGAMQNEKVFAMDFGRVYSCLVAKAERKGRTREEVDAAASWLTGYTPQEIAAAASGGTTYGDFFRQAPAPNPYRDKVTGTVCGVRVEAVEDPTMREIRRLDKMVDELAKGKPLEKVLRK
jgi:hypothetical protein